MKKQISPRADLELIELLDKYAATKRWKRHQAAIIILEDFLNSKEVQQVIEEQNKKEKGVKE